MRACSRHLVCAHACSMWPWLGSPVACDTLRTSGVIDDVMFAHNGQK